MGAFEFDENGMVVETATHKQQREKKEKGQRPKIKLIGVDDEQDTTTLPPKENSENSKKSEKTFEERKKSFFTGRVYKTKDGFFIRERYKGEIEEYKKKEKVHAKEEAKKKREADQKRKEEERQKRKEAKQLESNKKNGTYAGDGYHYEERELKMVDGDSHMVKVKVPNNPPKLKIAGMDDIENESQASDYGKEGSNNDGVQGMSFVCAGATLQCPFGTMTSKLVVGPDRTTHLAGKPMANIQDFTPLYNIPPFGQCTNPAFPATASATAAAMGTLTPMPCVPSIVAPWAPPKANFLVNGVPALLSTCMCQCMWGAVITIQQDGQ